MDECPVITRCHDWKGMFMLELRGILLVQFVQKTLWQTYSASLIQQHKSKDIISHFEEYRVFVKLVVESTLARASSQ